MSRFTPVQMIERLVGFDTVSRDSNMALIDFVRGYLAGHGIESTLVPNDDGTKANLYASVGPQCEGGVVLSGHTDVVPVDGQAWDTNPFEVTRRDGRLYGRGTADMKSFYAVALAMVPDMLAAGLARPIHFALSYDEEVGCTGAPPMINEMAGVLPSCRAVIVGEPTSMHIVNAHKGMFGFETVVTGFEAHSSQTDRGVSAVMTAGKLIACLAGLAEEAAARTDDRFDPPYTSVHVGMVSGGTAMNIISRECRFCWDVRCVPGESIERYVEPFEARVAELLPAMQAVSPECAIETRRLFGAPGLRPEAVSPAEELVRRLTGRNVAEAVSYGTEAGQFQEAGFSTVICGPGSIDQAHKPNEFIAVDQVDACVTLIGKLIEFQADASAG